MNKIQLEYETIRDGELANHVSSTYEDGRTLFLEDVHLLKREGPLDFSTQKTMSTKVNTSVNSMKGVLFLFTKTYTAGARDTEEFINPLMSPIVKENGEIEECLEICHDLFRGNKKYKVLVILDDCAVSSDVKNRSAELVDLAFSGRHIGISIWILTQQLTSISRPIRENVEFVVSFYNRKKGVNEIIIEDYGGSDIEKDEIKMICKILKENKYSRICFTNTYEVQIPNTTL